MAGPKVTAFVFSLSLLLFLCYYNYNDIGTVHLKFRPNGVLLREPIYIYTSHEDFLINTTGCVIPNLIKKIKFAPVKIVKQSCGERAIYIKKIANDRIVFHIDKSKMPYRRKNMENNGYTCCFMFVVRSRIKGQEDTHIKYGPCIPFQDGTENDLLEEVITVKCLSTGENIYEDAYIKIKKTEPKIKVAKEKWNVLIVGLDTMSRARAYNDMPKLVTYMQSHGWLNYRGYNKIASNTYPNLMAVLTGMEASSTYSACKPNMNACNDNFIWSTFRRAGYVTAYGEDYLNLPDTFSKYRGFQSSPTHHYMRPLFLTGEDILGNVVCTKHLLSGKHIVDYAYDLANTYKNDSFFGMFWINSNSHNIINIPRLLESDIIHLFNALKDEDLLKNTFVILLSDHGIRFGQNRKSMESYYTERLPMFFMHVPEDFQKQHYEEYYNLQLNQNRLVSPYDLYKTLVKISDMSVSRSNVTSSGCPTCVDLFKQVSEHRTCLDAGVNDKWCTCHDMTPVDRKNDEDGSHSVQVAVSYVQNKAQRVRTNRCWACESLHLDKVLRTHSYKYKGKTYLVIAFVMKPGDIGYEAIVSKDYNNFTIVHGVDTITGYHSSGRCVKNIIDMMWCTCKHVRCKN